MSKGSGNEYNNEGVFVMPGFLDEDESYEVSPRAYSVVRPPFRKSRRERKRWWFGGCSPQESEQ